nr:hypothetical protein [Herbaspirillum sp. B39]
MGLALVKYRSAHPDPLLRRRDVDRHRPLIIGRHLGIHLFGAQLERADQMAQVIGLLAHRLRCRCSFFHQCSILLGVLIQLRNGVIDRKDALGLRMPLQA